MSKFRKNKNANKIDVCGKVPVVLTYGTLKTVMRSLNWGVKRELSKYTREFVDEFSNIDYTHTERQYFFSVTKDHLPTFNKVDSPHRQGFIVSVGMLRSFLEEILPIIKQDRYSNHYRGDSRKKQTKSMEWVNPDFKRMPELMRLLDIIQFVKDSPCDVIEASGNGKVFSRSQIGSRHYGYRNRNRKNIVNDLFLSKRYESTSWYNICKKCYYDDHSDTEWAQNKHSDFPRMGMSYNTLLSELAMTLD
tara:strand:- start:5411 stop:6154 length:744 start_codon:yes stop_codon:yes gene_type:complete